MLREIISFVYLECDSYDLRPFVRKGRATGQKKILKNNYVMQWKKSRTYICMQ